MGTKTLMAELVVDDSVGDNFHWACEIDSLEGVLEATVWDAEED